MINKELKHKIIDELKAMNGKVGFYYKNLITGESFGFNENEQFLPASIVKLPLLAAMLLMRERGEIDFTDNITIQEEQKVPGCGAVQHITGDKNGAVVLDINTLYKLMIVISDNTATNALYRHLGKERICKAFKDLGLIGTQFNREYYDYVSESQGIQNYFVPKELCILLEQMYTRTLISKEASEELENILLLQQINHKIGGKLPLDFPIAHKTGEEDDKTHDIGIVYTKQPFVVCYASYKTDLFTFENFIRETTYELAVNIDPTLKPSDNFFVI